jgi:hypothetical protein
LKVLRIIGNIQHFAQRMLFIFRYTGSLSSHGFNRGFSRSQDHKKLTRETVVAEIARLQDIIKKYQAGEPVIGVYSYPAALQRLMYLRHKLTQIKKK